MKNMVLGIGMILLAVVVLLANVDFGQTREILGSWWPSVIVLLGLYSWWGRERDWGWPFVITLVGVMLLLNTLNVVDFNLGDLIFPLILAGIGVSVIASSRRVAKVAGSHKSDDDITAVLGGSTAKNTSDDYRGGNFTAVMGGIEFDLSHATIKKEAVINVFALMGGIEIRVPTGVIVKNRTRALLGGTEDKTSAGDSKNAPVLYIDGNIIMGGIEIKR